MSFISVILLQEIYDIVFYKIIFQSITSILKFDTFRTKYIKDGE
jgi:hypothetical protein